MKIEEFLKGKGIQYKKFKHPVAFTAQQIAAEQHVPGRMMIKTVVVKGDDKYYLAVLPAVYSVDFPMLTKLLDVQTLTLATESEMEGLFPDAEVGAEAPFGELYGLKTIVDERLADCDDIVFQAGDHSTTIKIRYDDYVEFVDAVHGRFGQHI